MSIRDRSLVVGRAIGTVAVVVASGLAAQAAACPPDFNRDDVVDGTDLVVVLGGWGGSGAADLDGSGVVDGSDLAIVLGGWGPCPAAPALMSIQLAGQTLPEFPWFEFVQAFNAGSPVSIAVDTNRLPELSGTNADLYVTAPNPAWSAGAALVDVRGMPQPISLITGGVAANTIAITGSAGLSASDGDRFGRGYDLVVDVNQNGVLDTDDLFDGAVALAARDDVAKAAPGFTMLPNLTLNGPHAVAAPINYSIAETTSGFSSQRLFRPTDIASMTPRPIVVISHGGPELYTWYDYLGTYLASWGYVVISHQNNTGPASITPAAYTTMQHTAGLINQQATIAGGVLNGHLDADTIIWIGQARGGEGIVRALDILFDGTPVPSVPAVIPFTADDIKLLVTYAPLDFLGKGAVGTGSDPHQVPFFLLWGSADGDACGCPGNNISNSFNLFERAEGEHWSTYIHGADHGDFTCCGFDDFQGPTGTSIGAAATQAIVKVHILAAIKSVLEGDAAARELRWRRYESFRPLGVHPTTPVRSDESRLGAGTIAVIDDFQSHSATETSSSGGVVFATVSNLAEGVADDINNSFTTGLAGDSFNGHTRVGSGSAQQAIVFDWSGPASIEWEVIPALADFTGAHALAFRAAQATRHPLGTATPSSFTVTLVDDDGIQSTLSIGAYRQGLGQPYQRTGFGTGVGWQNEMQIVRLPLDDFLRDGSPIDLTNITGVRLDFGGAGQTATGRIVLDDLSLVAE